MARSNCRGPSYGQGEPGEAAQRAAAYAADYFTAAICQVTGNRPASVCSAPFIKNLRGKL